MIIIFFIFTQSGWSSYRNALHRVYNILISLKLFWNEKLKKNKPSNLIFLLCLVAYAYMMSTITFFSLFLCVIMQKTVRSSHWFLWCSLEMQQRKEMRSSLRIFSSASWLYPLTLYPAYALAIHWFPPQLINEINIAFNWRILF